MMGRMDQQQAKRLGAALRAGREALGIEQQEMAARLGVERNALGRLEGGGAKRITSTQRAYAREIGWADGSIENVLAGGDPEFGDRESAVSGLGPAPFVREEVWRDLGLSPRLYRELQQGRVLENVLIDLTPTGSLGVAVVLIERPDVTVTSDQMDSDMRAWSRVQRQLLQLMAQQEPSETDA